MTTKLDEVPPVQDDSSPLVGPVPSAAGGGRSLRRRRLAVLCILVAELCERLTFYGVSANLVLYCQDILKLESPIPSNVTLAFQGLCFFTPILGGWLADRIMGRYNAIYGSALLYFVGTSLLCAASYDYGSKYEMKKSAKEGFLAASLLLIAAGTGGIKSSVSPLGADQIRDLGDHVIERFFDWFYWFVQLGGFLAYTIVVYVQQEISFFYGYLIPACAILLAIVTFLSGSFCIGYVDNSPSEDSRAADTIKITFYAIWNGFKRICTKDRTGEQGWLDRARLDRGGKWSREAVEDTRSIWRLLPIFLTFVLYWAIFSQGLTTYVIQAEYMKLKLTDSFTIPAASLNVFEIGFLLIILPVLDHGIYPLLRYFGFRVTPLQRIGVGMLFATGSVLVAGLVEIGRKRFIDEYGYTEQIVFGSTFNASDMNVFYQVPQYLLQGAGEALVSVTSLEMAFTQSPEYLNGVVMGVCLATIGLGYYLSSALASIVRSIDTSWYPTHNINKGNLEKYFFLLAGLMFLDFVIFMAVSLWCYQYREKASRKEDMPWPDESTWDLVTDPEISADRHSSGRRINQDHD